MKKLALFTVFFLCFTPCLSALTTEEVIRLKEKGVSDHTIQLMIQSEAEKKEQDKTSSSVKEVKTSDRTSDIIYSTGEPSVTKIDAEEQKNIDNAWEMLRNMTLEIEK